METSTPPATGATGILIRNVDLFNGKDRTLKKGFVLTEGPLIKAVAEGQGPDDPGPGVEIVDGRGKFLMPGLIDAHWHTYLAANTMMDLMTADEAYTQFKAGQEAGRTLLRGFTTVRDAGGPVFGIKKAVDEGVLAGPRIFPSGSMISQTGGHGDFRAVYDIPHPMDCCALTHSERIGAATIADGPDAVTAAARNNLRLGASQIKLMCGGGAASLYDRLEDVQFFEEEIHSAVQAAENAGTYVMVHVYVPQAIQQAIRAGVRSIEHGHLIDEPTMKMIAEHDVWLSMQPFTLGDNTYPSKEQQAKHEMIVEGTDRTYRLARQYGVKLAWGTDLLFNPAKAKDQNQGIAKLTKWFSNDEILKMVTHDNARLLALSGRRNPYPGTLGVIEEGALADLLLVDGNPMQRIELLTEPERNLLLIVKDGKICKRQAV